MLMVRGCPYLIAACLTILVACQAPISAGSPGSYPATVKAYPSPTPTPTPRPTPRPTPTTTPAAVQATPKPVTPSPTPASGTAVLLEIAVFDDTVSNPLADDFAIEVDGEIWFPDVTYGGDGPKEFGTYAIGEASEFSVYPEGLFGHEVRVPFRMTSDMISGSTMSQTTVAIDDTTVTVTGQAILDFEQTYPR